MAYATGRTFHDADSHIFEDPAFYLPFADAYVRSKMKENVVDGIFGQEYYEASIAPLGDPDFMAGADDEVTQRKLWQAMGAFHKEERSRALDLLGYSTQIVFDSFMRFQLREAEYGDDLDFLYGLADTHNRAVQDFCSVDSRLLPVAYVPMADIDRSIAFAERVIDAGFPAIQTTADCPQHHSPSHAGFEPMWARLAEASVPLIFHLGAGRMLNPTYHVNGKQPEASFMGGDGQVTSIDHMASPHPVMETLAVLILDGVLDRHPDLRVGLIEFAASWVPGWMRFLDSTMVAFHKNERRLQALALQPSEYVTRQVRVTPFPNEDVGWIIAQGGPEIFMFSSDYPHIEGGRNPVGRFEASMDQHGIDDDARHRFYSANFSDFLGGRVSAG
jgi:predicted TIM-barrel fold metal-dependent hydrolase